MSTDLVIAKIHRYFFIASKVWEVLIKPEMSTQLFYRRRNSNKLANRE
jgi:hypothetical protein